MAVEIRLSSLLYVPHDALEMTLRVLLASLCLNLSLRQRDVVCPGCAPRGRSCTLSLIECNSSSGLVDHQEPRGIESCVVDNDLVSSVVVLVIVFATQKHNVSLTYRTRPRFGDNLACCAPCCSLATARLIVQEPGCACVALMLIVEVLQVPYSSMNVSSC